MGSTILPPLFKVWWGVDILRKVSNIMTSSRQILCLEDKFRKLENTIDEADAYERRDSVTIACTGLPGRKFSSQAKNCGAIVQKRVKVH